MSSFWLFVLILMPISTILVFLCGFRRFGRGIIVETDLIGESLDDPFIKSRAYTDFVSGVRFLLEMQNWSVFFGCLFLFLFALAIGAVLQKSYPWLFS